MNGNQKEEVRVRLLQLREISQDPYYDQYLNQMLRDLESEKASPAQVAREADRTYRLYQERMAQQKGQTESARQERLGGTAEFKVGAAVFSMIGAVFVLIAFIIFGMNFLEGIWQGFCLYAVSAIVILISELLVKRISNRACSVITAIGIGGLFISTILNYSVLDNISEPISLIVTLVTALFSVLLSKKKDSASIRLITVLGCYICFFPKPYHDSDISFLCKSLMLLIVNGVGILFPNQKNRKAISAVHMTACAVFMVIMGISALVLNTDDSVSGITRIAGYVLGGLIPLNLIYFREKEFSEKGFTVIYDISLGLAFFTFFWLFALTDSGTGISERTGLLTRGLMEVQVLAVSLIFFVLWGKDKRRWSQYYFLSGVLLFLTDVIYAYIDFLYMGEANAGVIFIVVIAAVFLLARFLSDVKELTVLDCILEVLAAQYVIICVGENIGYGWSWFMAAVLFLALFRAKYAAVFHEIVVLLFFSSSALFPTESSWFIPAQIGTLFLLFLLINHLPVLKMRSHLPYNIVSAVLIFIYSLGVVFRQGEWIDIVTMLLGAVAVTVIFRSRYRMEIPRKYLLVAGYLIAMIFLARFPVPAITSALLMLVAIGCVAVGFWKKDKVYRIFGLVMALFVCVKLVIFDFIALETLTKMIIFFIVGIVALAISFLYIFLERKDEKKVVPEETVFSQELQTPVEEPVMENRENVQNISERNMEE